MKQFLSLRSKNMIAFLCISFITAIVGITGYLGMKKLEAKFNVVIESAPLIQAATNMKLMVSQDLIVVMQLMAALDTDQLSRIWQEHEILVTRFKGFKNAIMKGAELESGTIFPAKDETLRTIVGITAEYHQKEFIPKFEIIFDQMNKKLSAENYDYDLMDTIDEDTIKVGNQLGMELGKVIKSAQKIIKEAEIQVHETKRTAVRITVISTILGIFAAIVLGVFFSGIVTKPVIKTARFIEIIANGDFTNELEIKQQDEIGTMAKAMNKMVTSLADIFRDITTGVGTLNETSGQLSDVSLELKGQAREMSDKSNAVASEAGAMNQRLSSVAARSEESSSNLDTVSSAMEEMNSTINEIASNTGNARSISETAVGKAKEASVKVNELGKDANEIGKVTDVIGEISEQTNLLALNASIEAARAGEAGKGFAVVAGEIKELANQTAQAAKNIKEKIDRIQLSTNGTVGEIEEISSVIHDIDGIVSSIASAIEEQSITSKEMAQSIAQVANGIHETNGDISDASIASDNISNDISIVNENAAHVANSSQKVTDNVSSLTDFAGNLKKVLSHYKV